MEMTKRHTADYLVQARDEMIQARVSVMIANLALEMNMAEATYCGQTATRRTLLRARVMLFREVEKATQALSLATARHASALNLHYGLPLEIAF